MEKSNIDEKDDKINAFFSEILDGVEDYAEIINSISKSLNNRVEIPNLVISINNKFIEIYALYKDRGLDFSSSALKELLYDYFFIIIINSLKEIDRLPAAYIYSINILDIIFDKIPLNKRVKKHLDKINEMNNSIQKFDIEKDITDAFFTTFYTNQALYQDKMHTYNVRANDFIYEYNSELHELGLDVFLPPFFMAGATMEPVEHNYDGKTIFVISDYAYHLILEIKNQYSDYPLISNALENSVMDILSDAVGLFLSGRLSDVEKKLDRIKNFNLEEEMEDSIGKLLVKDMNTHKYDEISQYKSWSDAKTELDVIGLTNVLDGARNRINNNYYNEYLTNQKYITPRVNEIVGRLIFDSVMNYANNDKEKVMSKNNKNSN